ncbi:MAG: DUF2155 domain-containing protein [Terricaulis sp.]|nr:DUF2155 domain-containing protein [Terricaulis sp.]
MIRTLVCAFALFVAAAAPAYAQRAVVRGLDKVTGHASDYTLTIGRPARIGSLEVIARTCSKSAPEETPEVRIFVEVFEYAAARARRGKPAPGALVGLAVRLKPRHFGAGSPKLRYLGDRLPRVRAAHRKTQPSIAVAV